jgi:hypothetical protein
MRYEFGGGLPYVYDVAFSPDGRTLVTAGDRHAGEKRERLVRLWEVATGEERGRLSGHMDRVGGVAYSPDGRLLATASWDQSARIWDAATGRELASLVGHRDWVAALAFAPDGRSLVTGSRDTTALVWDLSPHAGPRQPGAGKLTDAELALLWEVLRSDDAAAAQRAIRTLAAAPGSAVPFLKANLRPARLPSSAETARMIAGLDSDRFAERARAEADLHALGDLALPALNEALAGNPSLEARRRMEKLVERILTAAPTPERLRGLRALEALERSGTGEAKALIGALARDSAQTVLTAEAQAATRRLSAIP